MGLTKYAKLFKLIRIETGMTQKELAQVLEVGAGSIYKYENDIMKPGSPVIEKVRKYCTIENLSQPLTVINSIDSGNDNEGTPSLKQSKGGLEVDARYLIDLQKARIDSLETELAEVRTVLREKSEESVKFASVDYDFATLVECDFKFMGGLRRRIRKMTDYHNLCKLLGITERTLTTKYFDLDVWHPHNEHPVNAIMEEESLKEVQKFTDTLPSLWNMMKQYTTLHHLTTPIIYFNKEKQIKVFTLCYVQTEWSLSPVRIQTKSKIIHTQVQN